MKHVIGPIVSLTIVTAAGCSENVAPTAPDIVQRPDFTGTWVGVSRVVSCESSAGRCAGYPVGHERYLDFRLTQRGDEVTGNLSPTMGGPTALPAVFWIAGRLAEGRLPFEPMEVAGASGGLTTYSGEVTLAASPAEMRGRMTERTTRDGDPLTIEWEVRTARR